MGITNPAYMAYFSASSISFILAQFITFSASMPGASAPPQQPPSSNHFIFIFIQCNSHYELQLIYVKNACREKSSITVAAHVVTIVTSLVGHQQPGQVPTRYQTRKQPTKRRNFLSTPRPKHMPLSLHIDTVGGLVNWHKQTSACQRGS